MKKIIAFVFIFIMTLSACGVNQPVPSASTEKSGSSAAVGQVSISGTKDGVDGFLSLYDYKSSYENDECFNITPEVVRQSGYSVFKYNESCASFLLYGDKVYPLGEWFGGNGVVSMAVYDLEGDGRDEFYFTFSWGSGIHRSHSGYFDPKTMQVTVFDYTYWNKDMMIAGNGDGLALYGADFTNSFGFIDYTMQTGERIADIVYEGGKVTLKLAEGAEVSAAVSAASPSPSRSAVFETKLLLYSAGKCTCKAVITDETESRIVKDAVFNHLLQSAAWEAVDLKEFPEYIEIHYQVEDGGPPSVYYAFKKGGKPCMQGGERYCNISKDTYAPLYELAAGNLKLNDMIIKSGDNSINALGNAITEDGFRLTPKQAASYLEYINIGSDLFCYIGGGQVIGDHYKPNGYNLIELNLYDTNYRHILTFPILSQMSDARKSDFRLYLLDHATWPGKYIVELSTVEDNNNTEQINQYFFEINLPEKPTLSPN
jgi:hypothetical protein